MPEMEELHVVYCLVDPFTKLAGYVGCCLERRLKVRTWRHFYDRTDSFNQDKISWIEEVLARGKEPLVTVVEKTTGEFWEERERYWISYYLGMGHPLTNRTLGGKGPLGIVKSEETRKLHQDFRHTEAAKDAIRQKLLGVPKSKSHRANLSLSKKGKPLSDTHLAAIAAAVARNPKCRARYRKGTTNGRAILSEDSVREIRKMAPYTSRRDLSARFGVSMSAIKKVVSGRTWGHI